MEVKEISIKVKLLVFAFMTCNLFELGEIEKKLIVLMLFYLITIFCYGFINNKYNRIIDILEGSISFVIGVKYIPVAMLLLSVKVIEVLLSKIENKIIIFFISLIPLFFVKKYAFNSEVILIMVILFIFFINYYKNQLRLIDLEDECENKRKEIYKLQDRLKEEEDFKEQFLYTMQLEERNKISGNLHDKIGHTISGTLLQLEAIKLTINNNTIQAKKLLDIAINNLRVGMDDIRVTLRDVRPQQEELGLNRIKLILDEKTRNTMFKYKILQKGDLEKITTANWVLFVQAVKELTTNIIKYSTGNLIEINLIILNGIIKLEVKDDGRGASNIKKGIGLSSLEEKVADKNGKLIINGEGGFSVILLIPFK